jgi:hypothetical protein
MTLADEFARIKKDHNVAMRARAARAVLGASVLRVFAKDTKADLFEALTSIPVNDLRTVRTEPRFRTWFERQLRVIDRAIAKRNRSNARILPGAKWGHATKVLSLFVREIVSNSRFFGDEDARRLESFLYVPLDSINIGRLRDVGTRLPFSLIREVDTSRKFYQTQDLLRDEARHVGVPRIWFDDNWAIRDR